MIRRLLILVLLFGLVWTGVESWYGRFKDQLAAGLPATEKRVSGAREMAAGQPGETKAGPTAREVPVSPDTGSTKEQEYQVIVKRNIFGAVLEQEAAVREEEKTPEPEPEKTTLKLTLLGTVSGNERDARAIIVDEKEKKQDIYQIGDAVQGALITEIKRGKVILEVDGRRQFLVIKERKDSGGGLTGSRNDRQYLSPSPPARTAPAMSRSGPPVVPHRRVSFRQKKENPKPPDNPMQQDPEMEIMPAEEAFAD